MDTLTMYTEKWGNEVTYNYEFIYQWVSFLPSWFFWTYVHIWALMSFQARVKCKVTLTVSPMFCCLMKM